MNLLPCEVRDGGAFFNGVHVPTETPAETASGKLEIGVRPEFVSFAADGIPVDVVKVADAGRHRIVETRAGDVGVKLLVEDGDDVPDGRGHLRFDPAKTRVYSDGWLAGEER